MEGELWVIPVVEAGRRVGEIHVPIGGETVVHGEEYLYPSFLEGAPIEDMPKVYSVSSRSESPTLRFEPRAEEPTEQPKRVELEAVEVGKPLPEIVSFFLGVDLEAARAKGREIYERALALAEQEGIHVIEALKRIGGRNGTG